MGTNSDERRRRGLDRLITFADAVAAIAITLLILPLVESVSTNGPTNVHELLKHDRHQLFVFVLSFAVIWRFWLAHRTMYEPVIDYRGPMVWYTYIFLLGIVFLPYPTEILGTSTDSTTSLALYIGTLFVITAANLGQQWIITRTPEIQHPDVRGTLTVIPSLVTTVLLGIALIVALTVPAIGVWALAILLASDFIDHWLIRKRSRAAAPPSAGSPAALP